MNPVNALEQQLKGFRDLAARRAAALRLFDNADFKSVILNEFMVQECARYAQTSGDPNIDAVGRADALAIAQSAGHLKRYLSVVVQMGNHAENEIVNLEQAIDEARAEEAEDRDVDFSDERSVDPE